MAFISSSIIILSGCSLIQHFTFFIVGVDDLRKFVSIALHTSEGDFSTARFSDLALVGKGYGPLIYGFKEDHEDYSFDFFQEKCAEVWKALKDTPNLPELLVHKREF